jgi:malate dehydrogenase (oxaloacetate-decarboxylating)
LFRCNEIIDENEGSKYIETDLTGINLLESAQLNKGTAFNDEEREKFYLKGLLPPAVETIEDQLQRAYRQYSLNIDALQKNIFLNNLYNTNETLFFRLMSDHIKEMMPIIYTPTAGLAIQEYSNEFRRPRGIYISYPDLDHVYEILDNRINPEIDLIVLTDSEQILGIGDQGANGIGISVAKLVIYTLGAGINPRRMLPIMIDVGTNNTNLLQDPLYIGWRHPRISREEYDHFVSKVIKAIKLKFPGVFLQWEDFGKEKARCNLDHYQDKICTFNDDIQGTGAVAMAAILNASKLTRTKLSDHRVVIFGAGTAGCGIADRISDWMIKDGLTPQEARFRFWLIDSKGLITEDRANLDYFKVPYARPVNEIHGWDVKVVGENPRSDIMSEKTSCLDNVDVSPGLQDVVRNVKPSILIGTSTVHGAFTKEVVTTMAAAVERPIIFPLSNPKTLAEAHPHDILKWTCGRALVAAGSSYDDLTIGGKRISIAQCNNAFMFPGLGLGVISAKAERVSHGMIDAAVDELRHSVNILDDSSERLLPDLSNLKKLSKNIAVAVALKAASEGIALIDSENVEQLVESNIWKPTYVPYKGIDRNYSSK